MNQNIWGPHAWFLLHSITLAYPLKPTSIDKSNHLEFLKSFGKIIMCDICKAHYNRKIKQNPPLLDSRDDYFKWMIDFHNEVNGRTGKRSYTYQEVLKIYQDTYQKDFILKPTQPDLFNAKYLFGRIYCIWLEYHAYIIISILILIILYLIYPQLKHK
jgi:hypothetical protein